MWIEFEDGYNKRLIYAEDIILRKDDGLLKYEYKIIANGIYIYQTNNPTKAKEVYELIKKNIIKKEMYMSGSGLSSITDFDFILKIPKYRS